MLYPIRQICEHPRIYEVDDFLNPQEVHEILMQSSDFAKIYRQGISTRHDMSGFSFEMPILNNPILLEIQNRLDKVVGYTNLVPNSMRYRSYDVGEYHGRHLDTYQINGMTLVLTAFMTLTDVETGGETAFPIAKPRPLTFPPKAGRLLLWYGHLRNGEVDQLSLHESLPVIQGIKKTLTYFYYQSLEYSKFDLTDSFDKAED